MQVYDKLVSDITSLEAELSAAVQATKFAKAASVQDELVVLKGRLDSMEIPSAAELDGKISELERQLKEVVEDSAPATVQEIIDTLKEERKDVLTSDEIDDLIDAKESELLTLIATANFTNCQKIHAEIVTWKAKRAKCPALKNATAPAVTNKMLGSQTKAKQLSHPPDPHYRATSDPNPNPRHLIRRHSIHHGWLRPHLLPRRNRLP